MPTGQWYPVRWTDHVIRVLFAGDKPAQLPDKIVDEIRKRQIGGFVKLPPPTRLKKGQQVRIIRGSFEGQVAVYEGMTGKDRERVLLDLWARKCQWNCRSGSWNRYGLWLIANQVYVQHHPLHITA